MPNTTLPGPLLPSVSIVEQTMRQARRAVAITLAGAALLIALLLGERLWSIEALTAAGQRHAAAQEVAGRLRVTEQQLWQAAQVASMSGDRAWYDRLVNELSQAVEHARLLAPSSMAERYRTKTAAAENEIAHGPIGTGRTELWRTHRCASPV